MTKLTTAQPCSETPYWELTLTQIFTPRNAKREITKDLSELKVGKSVELDVILAIVLRESAVGCSF